MGSDDRRDDARRDRCGRVRGHRGGRRRPLRPRRERLGAIHGVDGRRRWARPLDGHRRRDGSGDQAEPVDHPDAARADRALLEGGQPREGEGARAARARQQPLRVRSGQGAQVPRLDHCRARRPPNGGGPAQPEHRHRPLRPRREVVPRERRADPARGRARSDGVAAGDPRSADLRCAAHVGRGQAQRGGAGES